MVKLCPGTANFESGQMLKSARKLTLVFLKNDNVQNQKHSKEETAGAATAEAESGMMDYTFYKSVGTAIQDILTARMVVQRARELGVGIEVEM